MASDFPRLNHLTGVFYVLLILLLAQSSWGIQCLQCKKKGDISCTETEPVNCNVADEICFKAVVKLINDGQEIDSIQKGCMKYVEGEPLNSHTCEKDSSPPWPDKGHRCWCGDQDLCNHAQPLFQTCYWITFILIIGLFANNFE